MRRRKLLNQIFFDTEGGGAGGEGGAGNTNPQSLEVPEYISTYVSGIEDEGQRGYFETISKDEKGLNALKHFIKDPNTPWTLSSETYKDTLPNAQALIEQAKEIGYSEKDTQIILEQRANYLKTEKSKMSKEELAAEPNIQNFIATEQNKDIQQVYSMMSENAAGRKVLLELMNLKAGNKTPGISNTGAGGAATGQYDEKTFIAAFNKATKGNDKVKLSELESYARSMKEMGNDFYYDFMLLDK